MKLLAALSALAVTILLGIFVTWFAFMHTETVEPGFHGVIVDKPYFFGTDGVRKEPLKEGRILLWRTSDLQAVRVTPQSIQVKFDDFSSADNILLDFESTIQYQIVDAVRLVNEFGDGWFDNNIGRQYAAIVREAIKKKTMTDMMSNVSAAQEVDKEVTDGIIALVKESNLPIRIIGVSLGRAQPNKNVLDQMNETAAQQQRLKTLVEAEKAEVQRAKEQTARAAADNAYRNAIGLSAEQFIHLEAIKRYSDACKAQGNTCIVTTGQTPLVLPTK